MKKMIFALSLLSMIAMSAHASSITVTTTQLLVDAGVTDVETVHHNAKVYDLIFESIEQNIHNKSFVKAQIEKLNQCLEAQLASSGVPTFLPGTTTLLEYSLAPEFRVALDSAEAANEANQPLQVLTWAKIARIEAANVQTEVK